MANDKKNINYDKLENIIDLFYLFVEENKQNKKNLVDWLMDITELKPSCSIYKTNLVFPTNDKYYSSKLFKFRDIVINISINISASPYNISS